MSDVNGSVEAEVKRKGPPSSITSVSTRPLSAAVSSTIVDSARPMSDSMRCPVVSKIVPATLPDGRPVFAGFKKTAN